ncbi:hypothetical protein D9M69_679730 [compost metagenome]
MKTLAAVIVMVKQKLPRHMIMPLLQLLLVKVKKLEQNCRLVVLAIHCLPISWPVQVLRFCSAV